MSRIRVRVSNNFERNLDAIRSFLDDGARFEGVLTLALETVPELLQAHPRLGRDFFERQAKTVKGAAARRKLALAFKGMELRELVLDEHLILYVIDGAVLSLVAIKHHRQRTFQLGSL